MSNNNLAPTNTGPLGLGVSVISGHSGLPVNATPGDPGVQADIGYATINIAPGQRIDRQEVLISAVVARDLGAIWHGPALRHPSGPPA
ncbi:MAG: hypothetical protein ACK54T_10985 [bacterium]